jgi:hypothetical protein
MSRFKSPSEDCISWPFSSATTRQWPQSILSTPIINLSHPLTSHSPLSIFCSWYMSLNIPVNKVTTCVQQGPFHVVHNLPKQTSTILPLSLCRSRDSAVGIATVYGLDDRGVGIRVPVGSRIFSTLRRPDRFWGPLSLLSNGYRGLFPRG